MNSSQTVSSAKNFPYEGEMFYPDKKKFEEIIIFTHHYGGHKKHVQRHIQFVNEIGFQAFAFNLYPQPFKGSLHLVKKMKFGFLSLSSQWKKQIQKILTTIKGRKIIFSFSFSGNLVSSMVHKHPDVKALVLDGGPFARPIRNPWLYLSHQEMVSNPILRALTIIPWNIFFNFFLLKFRIHQSLKKLPATFPILSFQAEDDLLVPPEIINELLLPHRHLDITTALLKGVKHIQGMKTNPDIYKKILERFLTEKATPSC